LAIRDFTVKIGQEEIGHILNRKENLDHHGQMWDYMSRYQGLGWDLGIITAHGGADLGLDLAQPKEVWWRQLADLGLDGVRLNLAIRTGRPSRLLVLEVNRGGGTISLDLLGDWRSNCVAELGNVREQHYYYLAPEDPAPSSYFMAREVLIYGEDGLVLAPPSLEADARDPWRWLTPPWENPPQEPKPAVWQFLREQTASTGAKAPDLPTWDEVYRLVAPHEPLLKILLMPPASLDNYYRDLLTTALSLGLRDIRVLLGLLWHAPYGDSRDNPDRMQYLLNLCAIHNLRPDGTLPVPGPLAPAGASAGGSWPAPEPPALAGPALESLDMTLGVGELTRQLLGNPDSEPSQPRFEKTVSGQFFQLLAALGEKVIAESCRNEAIQAGLGTQATEMERLAAEIEQCLASPPGGGGNPKAPPRPGSERGSMQFPWPGVISPPPQKGRKLQEVKAMVQDFFSKNPDLAEDRDRVQMVLFSLKNYVSINPDYAGLSFRDKLEKAGQMARGFLGQPGKG
jgi:hypothetical protein